MRTLSEAAGEHVPPQGVRASAKRGLEMVKNGEAGDGLESATIARARKIAAGEALTDAHVKRMHSFFERHDKTRPDDGGSGKSPWRTAWMLWGGNAGRRWARSVANQLEEGWSLDLSDLTVVADADENELLALAAKDHNRLLREAKAIGSIIPLIRRFDPDQPRWPKDSPGGKGGEFMRVGQRFAFKGKTYEISSIKDGRVTAQLATGENIPDEVVLDKDEAEKLYPAKPTKVEGTYGFDEEKPGTVVVDPYVDSSTHSLDIPTPSNFTDEQWARFGEEDQRNYVYLTERFGEWEVGESQKIINEIARGYSRKARDTVEAALQSQYGASSGKTLSLSEIFVGNVDKATAEYEEAKLLLRDTAEVIQWDLYNRTQSPDVHLIHRGNTDHNDDWFSRKIPTMAGLSFATGWQGSYGGGSQVLVVPLAIRHVEMHTDSGGIYVDSSYEDELEATTGARLALDPDKTIAANEASIPPLARHHLESNADYQPVGGDIVYEAIEAIKDPDYEIPMGPQSQGLRPASGGLVPTISEKAKDALRDFTGKFDLREMGIVRRNLTPEELRKAPVGTKGRLAETNWEKISKTEWRMTDSDGDYAYFEMGIRAGDVISNKDFLKLPDEAQTLFNAEPSPRVTGLTGAELLDADVAPGDVFFTLAQKNDNQTFMVAVDAPEYPGGVRLVSFMSGGEVNVPQPLSEFDEDTQFVPVGRVNDSLYTNKAFKPMRPEEVDALEPVEEPMMLGKMPRGSLVRLETGNYATGTGGSDVFRLESGDFFDSAAKVGNANVSVEEVRVQSVSTGQSFFANAFFKTEPLGALRVSEPVNAQFVAQEGEEVVVTHKGNRRLARFVGVVTRPTENFGPLSDGGQTVEVRFVNANGKLGAVNKVDGESVELLPKSHAAPEDWEVGDQFSKSGKKYTVTSILKDGTLRAKPSGGKVEKFEPVTHDRKTIDALPATVKSEKRISERRDEIRAVSSQVSDDRLPIGTNVEVLVEGSQFYLTRVGPDSWTTPGGVSLTSREVEQTIEQATREKSSVVSLAIPYPRPIFAEFDVQTHVRPGDWAVGEKTKSRELKPGEMVSMSAAKVRPARVLEVTPDGKTVKLRDLETGKVSTMSGGQSIPRLVTRYSVNSEPFEVYNPFERLGGPGRVGAMPGWSESREMPADRTAFVATLNEAVPGSRLVDAATNKSYIKNPNNSWTAVQSTRVLDSNATMEQLAGESNYWELQAPDSDVSEWLGKEVSFEQLLGAPAGTSVRVEWEEDGPQSSRWKRTQLGWENPDTNTQLSDKEWRQVVDAPRHTFTIEWSDGVVDPKDTPQMPSGTRVSWGGSEFVFEKQQDGSWFSPDTDASLSPEEWEVWIQETPHDYFTVREDKTWTGSEDFSSEPPGTVLTIVSQRALTSGVVVDDEMLDSLPDGAVIIDKDSDRWTLEDGEWRMDGSSGTSPTDYGPFVVDYVPEGGDAYNGSLRFVKREDGVWAPWREGEPMWATTSGSGGFVDQGMANQTAAYGLTWKKTGEVASYSELLNLPIGSRVVSRDGDTNWIKTSYDKFERWPQEPDAPYYDSEELANWEKNDGSDNELYDVILRGPEDGPEEPEVQRDESIAELYGTTLTLSDFKLEDSQRAVDLAPPGSTLTLAHLGGDVGDAVFTKREDNEWDGPDGSVSASLLIQMGDRSDASLTLRTGDDVNRERREIFDGVSNPDMFLDSMGAGSYITINKEQIVKTSDEKGSWINLDGPVATADLSVRLKNAGDRDVRLEPAPDAFSLSAASLSSLPAGTKLFQNSAADNGVVLADSAYIKQPDGKWKPPASALTTQTFDAETVVSRLRDYGRFIQLPDASAPLIVNANDLTTLESLPPGTILRDADGDAWRRTSGGWHLKGPDSNTFSEFTLYPSGALSGTINSDKKTLQVTGRVRPRFTAGSTVVGDVAEARLVDEALPGAEFYAKDNPEVRWYRQGKDEGMGWIGPNGNEVQPSEIRPFLNTGEYVIGNWPKVADRTEVTTYDGGEEINVDDIFLYSAPIGTEIADVNDGTVYTKIDDEYWEDDQYNEYQSNDYLEGLRVSVENVPGGKVETQTVGPTVDSDDLYGAPNGTIVYLPSQDLTLEKNYDGDWWRSEDEEYMEPDDGEWLVREWPGATVIDLPTNGATVAVTPPLVEAAPVGVILKTEGGKEWAKRPDGSWQSSVGTVDAQDMADGAPHEVVYWPGPATGIVANVGETKLATTEFIDGAPVGAELKLDSTTFQKLSNGDWTSGVRVLSPEQMADDRPHQVLSWPAPEAAPDTESGQTALFFGAQIGEPVTLDNVNSWPPNTLFKDKDDDLWRIVRNPDGDGNWISLNGSSNQFALREKVVEDFGPFSVVKIGGESDFDVITPDNFNELPVGTILKDSDDDTWFVRPGGKMSLHSPSNAPVTFNEYQVNTYGPFIVDKLAERPEPTTEQQAMIRQKLSASPIGSQLVGESGFIVTKVDDNVWRKENGLEVSDNVATVIATGANLGKPEFDANGPWILRWPNSNEGPWSIEKMLGEDSVDSRSVTPELVPGAMVKLTEENDLTGDAVAGGFYRVVKVEDDPLRVTVRVVEDGKHQRGILLGLSTAAPFTQGVPPAVEWVMPSTLPKADLTPYKNKTYGEITFEPVGRLAPGTIFKDKDDNRWMLKIPGAIPVITDGEGNYTFDPGALVRPEVDLVSISGTTKPINPVGSAAELDALPLGAKVQWDGQTWEKVDAGEVQGGDFDPRWRVFGQSYPETLSNSALLAQLQDLSLPRDKAPFLDNSPPLVKKIKTARLTSTEELDDLPMGAIVRVESDGKSRLWQKTDDDFLGWLRIYPPRPSEDDLDGSVNVLNYGQVYIQEAAHER